MWLPKQTAWKKLEAGWHPAERRTRDKTIGGLGLVAVDSTTPTAAWRYLAELKLWANAFV